ncbi:unnamed protein product [Adineta ricciae]|uniref:CS domain-containing protein n=1 Tax=Adineta ricciae TaxID=249248 RepID=A0A814CN99_ADIRI|nr:unnamed protein product [Adineta ricciae]
MKHIVMNATGDASKSIVPSFVVQEEGARKVLVFLNIPELKVKRSFPNILKLIPSNGYEKELRFQDQSFTFTIDVQTKVYSMYIARLPGEIVPERCSIKYQRGGCWITLLKLEPMPWMNRICDPLSPGLDIQDDEMNQNPIASAPAEDIPLKDTTMPRPFNLVPLAPSPTIRTSVKKMPAPPPPLTNY